MNHYVNSTKLYQCDNQRTLCPVDQVIRSTSK